MSLIKQLQQEPINFQLGIPNGKLRPDDPFNRERKVTQRSSSNKNCLELCKQYVKVNLSIIKSNFNLPRWCGIAHENGFIAGARSVLERVPWSAGQCTEPDCAGDGFGEIFNRSTVIASCWSIYKLFIGIVTCDSTKDLNLDEFKTFTEFISKLNWRRIPGLEPHGCKTPPFG